MIDQTNPYAATFDTPAIAAGVSERTAFIRRTYTHLAGAVLALVALEVALFQLVPAETMQGLVRTMTAGYGWLIVLGAFMGVSWLARSWANSATSSTMQYAGLGLYVVAEAVILLPLLYIAATLVGPSVPVSAAAITAIVFILLTAYVMFTGADLAGWGKYLAIAGIAAMATIAAAILFGFNLGVLFSGVMVALACGYILYDTSNVLHHYRTDQHVAASLALFASVALLFWYVLRLVMAMQSRD